MVKRRATVLSLIFVPLLLSGCDDSDFKLPDRHRIPEPGLQDEGRVDRVVDDHDAPR